MRIAIAAFSLESLSFLPNPTPLADFERVELRGGDILCRLEGSNTVTAGFIDIAHAEGWELLPVVHIELPAQASATDEAFEHYQALMTQALQAERGALDGVLLHLHGALTTPSRTDPDGELIRAVRKVLGSKVPLIVAFDYHANLDEQTLDGVTAAFGFHYSPHTDMADTGRRAARCLADVLAGRLAPSWALRRAHVMVPSILSATHLDPLAGIVDDAIQLPDHLPSVRDVSVFAGFAYADAPNGGFSVLVITDNDPELAAREAQRLADRLHDARAELYPRDFALPLAEGLDRAQQALQAHGGPVVLLEHADRMNDSTHVLRAVLERQWQKVAVPDLWDPASVRLASEIGVGHRGHFELGGHSSERAGGPVSCEAEVMWLGPMAYEVSGPVYHGAHIDLGQVALLRVQGVWISVTENSFTEMGVDAFRQFHTAPERFDFVILRSKTHFRAVWEALASAIVIVDTPDWGPADLTLLPYRHVDRIRIYPFSEWVESA